MPSMPTTFFGIVTATAAIPDDTAQSRGKWVVGGLAPLVRALKVDDAIGSMTLPLSNLVPGSIYTVEVASTGATVLTGTAAGNSVTLTIPVYSNGSTSNQLRLKVRKASEAPFYQSYETQIVAQDGTLPPLFINQLSDE